MNRDLWYPLYINQELECHKGILPEISQYNVKKWMYDLYTIPPVLLCEYKQKAVFPPLWTKDEACCRAMRMARGNVVLELRNKDTTLSLHVFFIFQQKDWIGHVIQK